MQQGKWALWIKNVAARLPLLTPIRRILGYIVSFLFVIYACLLVENWNDTPPSSASLKLEEAVLARADVADEHNGYIFALGFSADKNQDPVVFGRAVADKNMQLSNAGPAEKAGSITATDQQLKLDFTPAEKSLLATCNNVDRRCQNTLHASQKDLSHWVESNEWIVARYQALLTRSSWQEFIPASSLEEFPKYQSIFTGQKLLLAKAWLAAGEDNTGGVKSLLESDVVFWRNVLASSDILITKMIAVAALKRHFEWGVIILSRFPPKSVISAMPLSWSGPLTADERSMFRCFAGEWQFTKNNFIRLKKNKENPFDEYGKSSKLNALLWRAISPMLQTQDSLNVYAEELLDESERYSVSYGKLPLLVKARNESELEKSEYFVPSRAYNLVGDYFKSQEEWSKESYLFRVTNLEGLRRIAVIALMLRENSVSVEKVNEALKQSELLDPYTHQPFEWDADQQAIIFKGLGSMPGARYSVLY